MPEFTYIVDKSNTKMTKRFRDKLVKTIKSQVQACVDGGDAYENYHVISEEFGRLDDSGDYVCINVLIIGYSRSSEVNVGFVGEFFIGCCPSKIKTLDSSFANVHDLIDYFLSSSEFNWR